MYNEKSQFTRLTLDQSDIHIEWSVPYENVTTADMMQAIRTLMIGMAFSDQSVEEGMANYLYEHSDKYDIVSKETDDDYGYDIETAGMDADMYLKKDSDNKPHYYA